MAHDKHLTDSERAHSGKPGSKVRHGQDALGSPGKGQYDAHVQSGIDDYATKWNKDMQKDMRDK